MYERYHFFWPTLYVYSIVCRLGLLSPRGRCNDAYFNCQFIIIIIIIMCVACVQVLRATQPRKTRSCWVVLRSNSSVDLWSVHRSRSMLLYRTSQDRWRCTYTTMCIRVWPVGARGNPPYPFTSPLPKFPPFTVHSVSLTFLFCSLHLFSCFSVASHSTRIVPLRFQTWCRRRRLNLALVFLYVLILCYMHFLVKDACFLW